MASSQSLLGLVNQLQNIEMTFTTILMESAMKLSALTDANIFVLVESQEGRRYCGKRHLCDAYTGSGLSPIGNDVEMEVNPSVSAVHERSSVPAPPSSHAFQHSPSAENNPAHGRGRLKRQSDPLISTSPAKQSRRQHPFSQLQHGQSPPQREPHKQPPLLEKDDQVVVVDIKREASSSPETDPNGNTLSESIEGRGDGDCYGDGDGDGSRKILDSDDSDFAEIVEEVRSPKRDLPLNSIEKALNRMTANNRAAAEPLSGGIYEDLSDITWQPITGSPSLQQYDNDTELSASEQDKVYERFLNRIAEDGRRKIEAVQSFGEDKILFVKGSAPQKILSSLCYSLGKAVTEECIEYGQVDPKSHFPKQLFVILIDRFLLDHFPQLIHAYAKLRHEIKKTFFSVLNKVKNKAVYSPAVALR